MSFWAVRGWYGRLVTSAAFGLSCLALSAFAGGGPIAGLDVPFTVPRANCGPGDHPESALQGQVPAYLRAAGFQGFNCNLQLIGQSKGDGANWQSAEFKDRAGHTCAYHGTSFTTTNRTHVGVPTIDLTNPSNPTPTGYLTSISMLDPWESLKVNAQRQLLAADNGHNGGAGPEVDIYDLSSDCRFPQLLSSIAVGNADGSTGVPGNVVGHEGSWAPDGLTYYIGNTTHKTYDAVDMTDPTRPALITTIAPAALITPFQSHGLSIREDGNRAYFVTAGGLTGNPIADLTDPTKLGDNGLVIYDVSDIQARKLNPQARLISKIFWKDGSVAQHTIPITIGGKPFVVFVDEGGSGGINTDAQRKAACAAGLPPFPMARIIDISDETKPSIVSRLALETHAAKACPIVLPDLVGLSAFTYGSHYCSVDNKQNATTLACGYFNSGIRVFDIRDPVHPKEIAYYNPAGTTTASPGSNHVSVGQWRAGGPDWCNAQVHLDAAAGTLWTTCQDNGVLMLKFTNGAWPFPESSTPPGQQN
jgi:hypothetical protein